MTRSLPERDWKYMKRIKPDLLAELCDRINRQSAAILVGSEDFAHEKYLKLFRHVRESDEVVAACFDDWRRSTLFMKILEIKYHGLLSAAQIQDLSEETQEKLKALQSVASEE